MKCNIKEAIILLEKGYVIGIPTDTVYGFAVLEKYAYKIYDLKGRNRKKKLITMLASHEQLDVNKRIKKEFETNWPGKVTYIFEEKGELKSYRIPQEPNLFKLLEESGMNLLTTSANYSGEEPALSASEFEMRFRNIPLLEEKVKFTKGLTPSKIYICSRTTKIKIR